MRPTRAPALDPRKADEYERILRAPLRKAPETLREFFSRVSPDLVYPEHLGPYLDVLDRAAREPVRCVISAPPRHTKTSTTLHKCVQLMATIPGLKVGVISYNQDSAMKMSREARRIAGRAQIQIGDADALQYWELANGSSFSAVGFGGTLTGQGFHIVIVDDPIKNREEAESPTYREKTYDGFVSDIFTRRQPATQRPTSFIVVATRWHLDDLPGRLVGQGWPSINIPAIREDGSALWPQGFPLSELRELEEQLGPYNFASLYLGQPRPRGESVFGDTHYYSELPTSGFRVSIGADFAYTSRTHSNCSAAVVLYHAAGVSYVAEVFRDRVPIEQFRIVLKNLQTKHGGKVTAFVAHTEKGSVEMLNPPDRDAPIGAEAVPAVADKFTRAQPVAAAWRAGKVLVPSLEKFPKCDWRNAFLAEVTSFTGVKDKHDDQVDALAGAYHPFTKVEPQRRVVNERLMMF